MLPLNYVNQTKALVDSENHDGVMTTKTPAKTTSRRLQQNTSKNV
jgi:hypothetical protein